MRIRILCVLIFTLFFGKVNYAAHLMGGEITWRSLGGTNYEFTLVIYRDCNGLDIIDPSLDLRVWGHPFVNTVTCNFLSTTDLSPNCTEVIGSPAEIDCGVGIGAGPVQEPSKNMFIVQAQCL